MSWDPLLLNDRLWKLLVASVIVAALAWMLATRPASSGEAAPPASVKEGFSAPDFTLPTLDGGNVNLSALRGQVVIINFWTTWCPPCRVEMPALNRVYARYRESGLLLLGVNSTVQDDEQAVRRFVSEEGLSFPVLLDRDGEVSRLYRLQALPTTVFVGRDGIIAAVVIGGPLSEAAIESRIRPLLVGGR